MNPFMEQNACFVGIDFAGVVHDHVDQTIRRFDMMLVEGMVTLRLVILDMTHNSTIINKDTLLSYHN